MTGAEIVAVEVPSRALGGAQPVALALPAAFPSSGERWRTLLLLHGMGGSHRSWPDNTDIAGLAAALPLPTLVVMPSGGESFYIDSDVAAMETFVCGELLAWLAAAYPRIAGGASHTGVTGLSMGGYGALTLALRRPDLFGSAASHSGAVLTSRATTEVGVAWRLAERLYGPPGRDAARRRDHDILALAERRLGIDPATGAARYDGPALYLDCGTDDFLYYASRELTQALRMAGVPYEYRESPGDHDWAYWRRMLPSSLAFHMRAWERRANPPSGTGCAR